MILTVYQVDNITTHQRLTLSDLKTLYFDCQCLGRYVLNGKKKKLKWYFKLHSIVALLVVILV